LNFHKSALHASPSRASAYQIEKLYEILHTWPGTHSPSAEKQKHLFGLEDLNMRTEYLAVVSNSQQTL
jgi:hypothetical protein